MSPLRNKVLRPGLTIEPLPSFYALARDAFRFLREVVVEGWGASALSTSQLRASGAIARTLGEGIDEVIAICGAAGDLSRCEIAGQGNGRGVGELGARLTALRSDEDATGDARGLVPLAVDESTGKVRVAALVGWELHTLNVAITHIAQLPTDSVLGAESHPIPVPVVREIWGDRSELLNRAELRELCDRLMARRDCAP